MLKPTIKLPAAFSDLYTPARGHVYHGGRDSAKSESVGRFLLMKGVENSEHIVCGREFQSSIKESVHSMLATLIEKENMTSHYTIKETEIVGENGTVFSFVGVRRNINNIKSMHNIKRFWGEEAQTFSQQSLDILFPTVRMEGSEFYFTMNADLEEDPAYQTLVVNPPPGFIVRKVNYIDNPFASSVLEPQREKMRIDDPAKFRNVYLGFPRQAVEGAIYANALQKASDDGRIGDFPYDDRHPVSVFADIGWADNTSLWFLQFVDHKPRVIDCYQSQFQKTPHYIQVLNDRKYVYDKICLPHDAENEHANADRTWMQIFRQAFPNATVYSGKRQAIELRLESAKNMFDLMQFHKIATVDGRSALAHYHFAIDPATGKSTREPFHGPESNYADAFGYMCLEMIESRKPLERKRSPIYSMQ
jgi:phage terminase large subunit